MTSEGATYQAVRSAMADEHASRSRNQDPQKWSAWIQTFLAVLAMVVSVMLAYSALDKRITLMEQKLDFLVQRVMSPQK